MSMRFGSDNDTYVIARHDDTSRKTNVLILSKDELNELISAMIRDGVSIDWKPSPFAL